MLANCLHALSPLAPDALLPLLAAMLLAGLAGGVTHCAGMCGPFVLVQATAAAGHRARWSAASPLRRSACCRIRQAGLIGYAALGSFAGNGGLACRRVAGWPFRWGWRRWSCWPRRLRSWAWSAFHLPAPAMPQLLGTLMGRILSAGPTAKRSLLLGLALSALPCGLLYGALAGAAAGGPMAGRAGHAGLRRRHRAGSDRGRPAGPVLRPPARPLGAAPGWVCPAGERGPAGRHGRTGVLAA
jgi:hypothetical protein